MPTRSGRTRPFTRRPVLLELDLTSPPVEPESDDPFAWWTMRGRRLLRPTLRALHEAGTDRRVGGLVIKVGGPLPWAAMQELRIGIRQFARSGKPTIAWAETFADGPGEMAGYVLATGCDQIWLQPGGSLGLLGVGIQTTFLRGALDKLGVEPDFQQRHEYKNAADQVLRTDYSVAHREALQRLVDSVFDVAVDTVAEARRLAPERVRALVDQGPRTAHEALDDGLVDVLGYRDQVYAALTDQLGGEPEVLFADRWRPARRPRPLHRPGRAPGHVALVDAHGGITSGRTRRGPMGRQLGSDSVSAQLRAAAEDDAARAVVLKIDSPGGSAVASEVIWREVVRLRESGKPVVVSMGEVAASGGYYIACPADVIVALPGTLTGSIGVFGGKFVTAELLERLGLSSASVQQGDRALMWSGRRRFSDGEQERLSAAMDAIYADFVGKVAEGRGRTTAEIDELARGRVWTGQDAYARGLVDELGGLRDAVRIARTRADLPDRAPVRPAVHVGLLDRLSPPRNSADPRAQSSVLGGLGGLAGVSSLDDLTIALGIPSGTELRMPPLRLR